jgi:aminopeptidase N
MKSGLLPRMLKPRVVLRILWTCPLLLAAALPAGHLNHGLTCAHAAALAEPKDPGAPRHYAPSRKVDIVHQRLEITPDFDRRRVAGETRIDFAPVGLALQELRLDAVGLTVPRIESSADLLGWHNTGEELVLTFRDPVGVGVPSWVRVVFSVEEPAQGLYFRTPAMGYREGDTHLWTQGEPHEARHWFPGYDHPNEKLTTEMICHVPEGMVALSNGRLVAQRPNPDAPGLVTWHWLQDQPHVNYLVTLCAGYFVKIEDQYRDIPLAFWTPPSRIAFARNSFAGTREMMAFFERETGVAYPWARYDQVVVDDFTWGGMENTAQTTLTSRTLYPDELQGTRSSLGLVAHELAHQWFGNYVTCKDWSHLWLNEGFATYSEALYREYAQGRDEFLWDMLENARAVFRQENDKTPMVHRAYQTPEDQFDFRAYPKGAWILHMLRSQLGPDLYRRCVQEYLQRHAHGVVTTDDLVTVLEELSGRDWDRFFDQFVYHARHPELTVSWSWDERTRLARLTIRQTQPLGPTVRLFQFPLPVRFQSGSSVTDGIAHVSRSDEDFYFALPAKPEQVRIDPDFTVLARIDFNLPTDMLVAQLNHQTDLIGRVQAIEQLAERHDSSTLEHLRATLQTDPFWGVRIEAAKALRRIHTDAARSALVASTNQPDPRVRREVIQGLAGFYRSDTPTVLANALSNETNPDILADGIRALAAYPVAEVRGTLLEQLRSDSYEQILAEAALEAIREQQDPIYLEDLVAVLRDRQRDLTAAGLDSGLHTLATLAADQTDRRPYREFIAGHLNHPSRRVQVAAARALGILGDPQAIPALATLAEARYQPARAQAAGEAIRQLRAAKPQPAELDTLRREVLDLQKQQRELRQQLEDTGRKLEALQP